MNPRLRVASTTSICFCLAWSAVAGAQEHASAGGAATSSSEPAGDSVAEARKVFFEGAALAKEARWAEALAAFEKSAKIRPGAGTTYNIAYCERALGRWTRAYKAFASALSDNAAEGHSELPASTVDEAKVYLRDVEPHLAKISAVVVRPEGATITVDARPLEQVETADSPVMMAGTAEPGAAQPAPAAPFPLWLDPGVHVFVLVRDGIETVLTKTLAEGVTEQVELEGRRAPQPAPKDVDVKPSSARPPLSSSRKVALYGALGVAGAGIVAGSITGTVAIVRRSNLGDACPNSSCPPEQRGAYDDVGRWATAATVSFGVGVAGAAASALLFFWPRPATASTPTSGLARIAVTPCGTRGLAVSASF